MGKKDSSLMDIEAEIPIEKPKDKPRDDYAIEEIFKGSKFAGVKMTHLPTGINIFRELRRGQFIPDREMKAELKRLIPR